MSSSNGKVQKITTTVVSQPKKKNNNAKKKPARKSPQYTVVGQSPATAGMRAAVAEETAGKNRAGQLVLSSFALPSECAPQRVATGMRSIDTTILRLENTIAKVQGMNTGFTDYSMTANTGFVVLRNDALSACQYPSFPTAPSVTAPVPLLTHTFASFVGIVGSPPFPSHYHAVIMDGEVRDVPFLYRDNAQVGFVGQLDPYTKRHTETIDGNRSSKRWLYFDHVDSWTWTWTSTGTAIAVTDTVLLEINSFRYDGAEEFPVNTSSLQYLGAGPYTFSPWGSGERPAGWYRFTVKAYVQDAASLVVVDGQQMTIEVSSYKLKANAWVLNSAPMYQLQDHVRAIQSFRTPAAAVLMSNETPLINLGGDLAAVQTPPGEGFYPILRGNRTANDYSGSFFDNVAAVKKAYKGLAKDGVYGWLKPGSYVSLAQLVSTFASNDAGLIMDSWGPIDSEDGDVIFAYSSLVTQPQQFMLRVTHHLEFVTTSQWFETGLQQLKARVYESVIDEIGNLTQFTENPQHTKLFNDARALVKGVGAFASDLPAHVMRTSDDYVRMLTHVRKNAAKVSPRLGALLAAIL